MKRLHKNTNVTVGNIRAFHPCGNMCWCHAPNPCGGDDNVNYGVNINSRLFPQNVTERF